MIKEAMFKVRSTDMKYLATLIREYERALAFRSRTDDRMLELASDIELAHEVTGANMYTFVTEDAYNSLHPPVEIPNVEEDNDDDDPSK